MSRARAMPVAARMAVAAALLPACCASAAAAAEPFAELPRYNIVWDSPSTNATGSMPLGGGSLGLNVWVEGGDVLFYIGHPDSRTEDEKLVKLGRVRLTLTPSPFKQRFRQELDLAESLIRISGDGVTLKLWVDAFQPVAGRITAITCVDYFYICPGIEMTQALIQ